VDKDYFTLMEFFANGIQFQHALSKSHTIKDLWDKRPLLIAISKSNILVMGTCGVNGEARYILNKKGRECLLLWW
jgi:hypothetical protein